MAPLGGLAMVRPGWCALFVCGNTGEARQRVPREKRTVGSQIGGSTNAPRPSRGRRAEGMGDDGTRDTASTRARTSASAGRLFAGGLRDVTHVAHSSGAGCFFSRTHLASAFVYRKQQQCPSTPNRVAVWRRERVRAAWARLGSSGCVRARVTPSPGSACGAAVRCDANPDAKPVNIVVASSPSDAVESPRKSVSRKLTRRPD